MNKTTVQVQGVSDASARHQFLITQGALEIVHGFFSEISSAVGHEVYFDYEDIAVECILSCSCVHHQLPRFRSCSTIGYTAAAELRWYNSLAFHGWCWYASSTTHTSLFDVGASTTGSTTEQTKVQTVTFICYDHPEQKLYRVQSPAESILLHHVCLKLLQYCPSVLVPPPAHQAPQR